MAEKVPIKHAEPAGARHFKIIEQLKANPEIAFIDVIRQGGFSEGSNLLRWDGVGVNLTTTVIIAPKTPSYGTHYDEVLNGLGDTLQVDIIRPEVPGWLPSFFDRSLGRARASENIGTRNHSQTTRFSFDDPSIVANLGYPEATDFNHEEAGPVTHTTDVVLFPDAELAELATECLLAMERRKVAVDPRTREIIFNLHRFIPSEKKVGKLKKILQEYRETFPDGPNS